MQFLDLGGRGLHRVGERSCRRGFAIGIEPRPELPLLAPREPACVARLLLNERERLQHRIVHARGEVGAFLAAHALGAFGIALANEPERPGDEDQHQRNRDRPGREQRRSRAAAVLLDKEHDAEHDEDDSARL